MISDSRSVIIFAGALYDSPLWTNRQHIATRLAERGWRVLYVEPRFFLPRMLFSPFPGSGGRWLWLRRHLVPWRPKPNLVSTHNSKSRVVPERERGDVHFGGLTTPSAHARGVQSEASAPRTSRSVRQRGRPEHPAQSGEQIPNLWVLAQSNRIPGSRRSAVIGRLNHVLFNAWNIRWHARRLGFRQPVLLLYDTESAEFLDDFPTSRVVYDCVDDHRAAAAAQGRNPALVEREEAVIVGRAAAIAVTVERLRARFARVHPAVHLVDNAADVGAFLKPPAAEPADIAHIPHPRVGTVGALAAYKLDVPLLAEVIRAHPDWQFVFVGPVEFAGSQYAVGRISGSLNAPAILPRLLSLRKADLPEQGRRSVTSLGRFRNVHFLGPKPREQVPAYVHAFDVAMIPYRESAYNRASFPLKFWEFLASGKPAVASGLPALEPYGQLVALARTAAEFGRALELAIAEPASARAARQAEAAHHGWETRVEAIEELLRDALTVEPPAKTDKKYRVQ